jgi:hypothetical protein
MTPRKLKPTEIVGLDGVIRDGTEEKRLNDAFAACFRDLPGQRAIEYLRSVTVFNVTGGKVSDAELRHLEGQRYLYALIEARITHGRNGLPKLSASDTASSAAGS